MKKQYDFSKAVRGKFYRKGAVLRLPIYLEMKLQNHLTQIARKKHQEMGEMVNRLIRKEMEMMQQFL
jgi:hypothetical protein